MAAGEGEIRRRNDERLNFLSSKFDPLKALYTPTLQPPVPNIQVFNNLAEYARAIKDGVEGKLTKARERKPVHPKPVPTRTRNLKPEFQPKALEEKLRKIAENFGAADGSVGSKFASNKFAAEMARIQEREMASRKKKRYTNVFDKMEACSEGPFSILYTCLKEKKLMKVWTRRYKGLRGVMCGYLIAFDKHMNLAMMDVDEVYTLEQRITRDPPENENRLAVKKKKKKKKKKKEKKINKSSVEKNIDKAIEETQKVENKYIQETKTDGFPEDSKEEKSLHVKNKTEENSRVETTPDGTGYVSKPVADEVKHTVFSRDIIGRTSDSEESKSSDEEFGTNAAFFSSSLQGDTANYFSSFHSGCARTRGSTMPLLNERSKGTDHILSVKATVYESGPDSVSSEESESLEDHNSVLQNGCARTRGSTSHPVNHNKNINEFYSASNEFHSASNNMTFETKHESDLAANSNDEEINSRRNNSQENVSNDFLSYEGNSARTRGRHKPLSHKTSTITDYTGDNKSFQTKSTPREVSNNIVDEEDVKQDEVLSKKRDEVLSIKSVKSTRATDSRGSGVEVSNNIVDEEDVKRDEVLSKKRDEVLSIKSVKSTRATDSRGSGVEAATGENKLVDRSSAIVQGKNIVCDSENSLDDNDIPCEGQQKAEHSLSPGLSTKRSVTNGKHLAAEAVSQTDRNGEHCTENVDTQSSKIETLSTSYKERKIDSQSDNKVSGTISSTVRDVAVDDTKDINKNDRQDKFNCNSFKVERSDCIIADKGAQMGGTARPCQKQQKALTIEAGSANTETENVELNTSVERVYAREAVVDVSEVKTFDTQPSVSSNKESDTLQQKFGNESANFSRKEDYTSVEEVTNKISVSEKSKQSEEEENLLLNFLEAKELLKLQQTESLNTEDRQQHDNPFDGSREEKINEEMKHSGRFKTKNVQETFCGKSSGALLSHTDEDSVQSVSTNYLTCAHNKENNNSEEETKNSLDSAQDGVFGGSKKVISEEESIQNAIEIISETKTKQPSAYCTKSKKMLAKNFSFASENNKADSKFREHDTEPVNQCTSLEKRNTLCSSNTSGESNLESCESSEDPNTIDRPHEAATAIHFPSNDTISNTHVEKENASNSERDVESPWKIDPNMKGKSLVSNKGQLDSSAKLSSEKEEGEITSSDEDTNNCNRIVGKGDCKMESILSNVKKMKPKEEKEEGELSSSEEEEISGKKQERKSLPKVMEEDQGSCRHKNKYSSHGAKRTSRYSARNDSNGRTHSLRDSNPLKDSTRRISNKEQFADSSHTAPRVEQGKSGKSNRLSTKRTIEKDKLRMSEMDINASAKTANTKHIDLRVLLSKKKLSKEKYKISNGEERDKNSRSPSSSTKKETYISGNSHRHRVKTSSVTLTGEKKTSSPVRGVKQIKESVPNSHKLGDILSRNQRSVDNVGKQSATKTRNSSELRKRRETDEIGEPKERNQGSKDNIDKQLDKNSRDLRETRDIYTKGKPKERNPSPVANADKQSAFKNRNSTGLEKGRELETKTEMNLKKSSSAEKKFQSTPRKVDKQEEKRLRSSPSASSKGKKRLLIADENGKPVKRRRLDRDSENTSVSRSPLNNNWKSSRVPHTPTPTRKYMKSSTDRSARRDSVDIKKTNNELHRKSTKCKPRVDSGSNAIERPKGTKCSSGIEIELTCLKNFEKIDKHEHDKGQKALVKDSQKVKAFKCVHQSSKQESRVKTSSESRRSTNKYDSRLSMEDRPRHRNQQTLNKGEKCCGISRILETKSDHDTSTTAVHKPGAMKSEKGKGLVKEIAKTLSGTRSIKAPYQDREKATGSNLDNSCSSGRSETSERRRKTSTNTSTKVLKDGSASESSVENKTLQSVATRSTKNSFRDKCRSEDVAEQVSAGSAVKPCSEKQTLESEAKAKAPILPGRTLKIGRDKYLVFKRRHVNQLFVRGDNVVMVGYAR